MKTDGEGQDFDEKLLCLSVNTKDPQETAYNRVPCGSVIIVNEKYIFRLLLADMQGANVVCGSARQYK